MKKQTIDMTHCPSCKKFFTLYIDEFILSDPDDMVVSVVCSNCNRNMTVEYEAVEVRIENDELD